MILQMLPDWIRTSNTYGARVLMKVQQERNKLQDAHTQLGEELKGVRAELSGSVKENQRLRHGIYGKYLSEFF